MSKSIEELKEDIRDFFSDTSRNVAGTRDGLEELACEIDMLLDSLPDDNEEAGHGDDA